MAYDISIDYRDGGGMYRVPLKEHPVEGFKDLKEAYLSIPYSFEPAFVRVFGENGIRVLDDMSIKESIAIINSALEKIDGGQWDFDDPWIPDRGNVERVLKNLRSLGEQALKEHPNESIMWTVDWLDRQER